MTPKRNPEPLPITEDSRGALLMPPSPPEPGTIRVLIAEGCTWTTRQVPGAMQCTLRSVAIDKRTKAE